MLGLECTCQPLQLVVIQGCPGYTCPTEFLSFLITTGASPTRLLNQLFFLGAQKKHPKRKNNAKRRVVYELNIPSLLLTVMARDVYGKIVQDEGCKPQ